MFLSSRLVRHIIEVAFRIGKLVVDRRKDDRTIHAHKRQYRLDRPGCTYGVAEHGLVAAHRDFPGPFSEDLLYRDRLSGIVLRRGSPVGIDIVDVTGRE